MFFKIAVGKDQQYGFKKNSEENIVFENLVVANNDANLHSPKDNDDTADSTVQAASEAMNSSKAGE